jgi:ABC-type enterochelin transport system ATPase subunit
MVKRWKKSLSGSKVKENEINKKGINKISFRTVILNDGNVCRLKLKSVTLKDAGDFTFQCGDLKETCKLTIKECMRRFCLFLFN